MPGIKSDKVHLDCGTLIIITLIVPFLSGSSFWHWHCQRRWCPSAYLDELPTGLYIIR